MTRNSFQALGLNLDRPADFIVCYTDGGKLKGGTAQALRIAADYQIPVFNAGNYANEQDLKAAFNQFYFGLLHKEKMKSKIMDRFLHYVGNYRFYRTCIYVM